jgi:hypothetical protein
VCRWGSLVIGKSCAARATMTTYVRASQVGIVLLTPARHFGMRSDRAPASRRHNHLAERDSDVLTGKVETAGPPAGMAVGPDAMQGTLG